MDWIQSKDRLPKHEEQVLVCDDNVVCYARCSYSPSGAIYLNIFDHTIYGEWHLMIEENIYWMPLPKPPNR